MNTAKKQILATLVILSLAPACTRYWEKSDGNAKPNSQGSAITLAPGGNGGGDAGSSLTLLSASPSNGQSGISQTTGIQLVFSQSVTGFINPNIFIQAVTGSCDFTKALQIREATAPDAVTCVGVSNTKVRVTDYTLAIEDTALKACTQYLMYLNRSSFPQLDTDKAVVFSTGGCTTSSPMPSPTGTPTGVPSPTPTGVACTYDTLHSLKQVEIISNSAPLGSVSRTVDTFPRSGQTQIFFGPKNAMRPFPLDYSQDVFFQIQFSDNVGPVSLPIQTNPRSIAEVPRKMPFPAAPTYSDPDYQAVDTYDHGYAYSKYSPCDANALIHLYKSSDPSRCVGVNRTGFAPHHWAWTGGKTLVFDVPYLEPSTFYTLKIRKSAANGPVPLEADSVTTFQTASITDANLRPVSGIGIVIPSPGDVDGTGKVFSSYPQRSLYNPQDQVAFKDLNFFVNFTGLLSPNNVVQATDGPCLGGYQVSVYEQATGKCLGGQNVSLFTAQVGSAIFPKRFTQLSFRVPNLIPKSSYTANLNGTTISFKTAPKVCGSPDDGTGMGSAVYVPTATPVPVPSPATPSGVFTPGPVYTITPNPVFTGPIPKYSIPVKVPFGAPVIVNPLVNPVLLNPRVININQKIGQ